MLLILETYKTENLLQTSIYIKYEIFCADQSSINYLLKTNYHQY